MIGQRVIGVVVGQHDHGIGALAGLLRSVRPQVRRRSRRSRLGGRRRPSARRLAKSKLQLDPKPIHRRHYTAQHGNISAMGYLPS